MDRNEAVSLCMCRICPSFIDCNEMIAFCMIPGSRSRCIKKEAGCLCPGCPVQDQEGYGHVYYCIRGSEKEQQ